MGRDMVDFAWGSVARSISVSRYTCNHYVHSSWNSDNVRVEAFFSAEISKESGSLDFKI